ncbi:MAG: hypothetical protein JWS10_140 [Cypionkella sp.]|uniref:hypothetical protein n=1 Tax=Cypionkella sp. TaxID=2811411 RepID=UPI002601B13E|nr:hypothetical protein [Cypionkella sp.]MDB5657525.1 hypothetical protein [Cypionkella sp.]
MAGTVDSTEILLAIRVQMLEARRKAAASFQWIGAVEPEFAFYQRQIEILDRAIADEERLKTSI